MKTLIINGSPRKTGDTVFLINKLTENLKGDIITINTYYDNINPCNDCRYCWDNPGCAIQDKMQEIYKLLDEVDNVIIASPIYFSLLTGSLLNFASRLQYFYASKCIRKDECFSLKNKMGALILVGGGDGKAEPAINTANILFHQMNTQLIDYVCSLNTNSIPTSEDKLAIIKIDQIAEILNKSVV